MIKNFNLKLASPCSIKDKFNIETELEVLPGIKNANFNYQGCQCFIRLDDSQINFNQIKDKLNQLGYKIIFSEIASVPLPQEFIFYVQGMHCASCEILIEKKLLTFSEIKSVEASTQFGRVVIEASKSRPTTQQLNNLFRNDGYTFFEQPPKNLEATTKDNNIYKTIVISGIIILIFILLNRLGLNSWLNVNSQSALPTFFLLGILAGLSTCTALVGGIILSMSKQWLELYQTSNSTWQKLKPHLMFNFGRLISYGFLGMLLGAIGSKLQLSFTFNSFLVILVSILMVLLAFQMLGVKSFRKFQLTMPKFITRRVADETKFQGRSMPFLMGALTFFLPCGFTITAQGLAILSGSAIQGGLIMFLFVLGTTPALLAIGFSSIKFSSRPHLAGQFLKVAGILVLFFAFFNINSQLNVLGLPSFSDLFAKSKAKSNSNIISNNNQIDETALPAIINGKQVIKMAASAFGYNPNYFKVRVDVPVRWEITDTGTGGCTNAIISRSLFDGAIELTPGTTSIKEFTPTQVGKYKFSCWMGMISGIIEVVDQSVSSSLFLPTTKAIAQGEEIIPSGAQGCGCGGGGGSNCSTLKN